MRINEILNENRWHKAPISFPDGDIYLSKHLFDRRRERYVDMSVVAGMLYDAVNIYGDQIAEIGPENFAIVNSRQDGIGIAKVLQPDDTYKYVVSTISPTLRVGRGETVFRVDEHA